GGVAQLALTYYKIDFTKEQRQLLQGLGIELIYAIDPQGVPTLEKVNGITDEAILDSLRSATSRLPAFTPRRVAGERESALYFLQLHFPEYSISETVLTTQQVTTYRQIRPEDVAYIHKSGERLDVLFGGAANTFIWKPGEYLATGGGMKVELMYTGKRGIGGGMVMSFYGNKLKQDYPLSVQRELNAAPPTLFIGLGASKILKTSERSEFQVQAELSYAVQNVTPKLDGNDKDWVQLRGISPAVVANYSVKLGKDKISFYYGAPAVYNHYLSLHAGVRPVFFNLKEATGVMVDVGISYRLASHFVDEYRLKAAR
ncbi:MAG TPA: hypothetical protein VIG72_04420, partial [Pontibacter sp.]